MAQSMEEMTKKLDGLETLLKSIVDKLDDSTSRLHRLETAPPPPPEIQQALDKLDATSARISRLEALPPPIPPPPPPPRPEKTLPPPPSRWVKAINLNSAPQQEARPSASTWERPNGHCNDSTHRDVGGGSLDLLRRTRSRVCHQIPSSARMISIQKLVVVRMVPIINLKWNSLSLMVQILDCGRINVSFILRFKLSVII
ncbi:unnamed protein product [Urochloa humidicola]